MSRPATQDGLPAGTILHVFELFMDWVQANCRPLTHKFYHDRIDPFVKGVGNMRVADLKTHHAQAWLDSKKGWSDSYKAGVVASIKRAFSWAVKQDLIDRHPLHGLKNPPMGRRQQLISPETFDQILSYVIADFFPAPTIASLYIRT